MTDSNLDPTQHNSESTPHDTEEGAAWWNVSMTRRQAAQTTATASVAVLLSASGIAGCCGDSSSSSRDKKLSKIEEMDSVKAQKKHGWDVGDKGKALKLSDTTKKDSTDSSEWKDYKDPKKLINATQPTSEDWRAHASPTLFQALEQKSLAKKIKPISNSKMDKAHAKAPALASLILATKTPENTLFVVDLPGPEAVALAAGMAHIVEPVFYFDNWPHPDGVVDSQNTLAASLYYAKELEEGAKKRDKNAPKAIILDSNRLAKYSDSSSSFDNRYIASLPDASKLKKKKISNVLYVTKKRTKNEQDDLNGAFVEYKKKDIKVNTVPLTAFRKDPKAPSTDTSTGGYYYGGGYHHHRHFYSHYPMFIFWSSGPRYSTWSRSPTAPPAGVASKPAYSPTARKTMFSNRTTGTKAGVGRTKPSGFGRVSMRKGAGGSMTRMSRSAASSARRSGSFGRSRGGSFG